MRFRKSTAIFAAFALASALAATPDREAFAKSDKAKGQPEELILKGQGKSDKGGKPDHAGKPEKGGKSDKADDRYDRDRHDDDRYRGDERRDEDRYRYEDRSRQEWTERHREYRDDDVRDEFRRYWSERGDRAPDYLRNPKALPPGIAMNLQRGKPLPPGIAKKVDDDDLLRRLPRSYPGSEWYAAGDRLVEYDPVNEAIIHVIDQALYGRR